MEALETRDFCLLICQGSFREPCASKSADSYRRETAFPFFPQFKHEGDVVFSGKVFSTQSLQEEKL